MYVDIKLYKPVDKVKEFQGELVGLVHDNIVRIEAEERKFHTINNV